jgi:NitT/TauT family transport system ATP-binding protein
MDEPFGPLDAQTRQIMGNLLLDLWSADRKAVLFVTHELEEAIALSRPRGDSCRRGRQPASVGEWTVPLPRPRDIADIRLEALFHKLHREIWAVLKAEVLKTYAAGSNG